MHTSAPRPPVISRSVRTGSSSSSKLSVSTPLYSRAKWSSARAPIHFAREYNGVETLNFDEVDNPVMALREMTGGRGADVCIDAVGMEAEGSALERALGLEAKLEAGAATALAWCIQTARKGGNVSIVGVYGPPWNLVPIGTAINKGLTLRINQCNVKLYVQHLLEHHPRGAEGDHHPPASR